MDRRSFLRAGAGAVAAGPALELQHRLQAHGVTRLGGNLIGGVVGGDASGGPKQFTNFAKWWSEEREREVRQNAKNVMSLDADLLSMQSPSLTMKIRMQAHRNYKREKERSKADFLARVAKKGFFPWWVPE